MMDTKKCSKCEIEKPLNEYYKDKRRRSGLRAKCKDCEKDYASKYRILNHDYELRRHFKYHEKHMDKEKKWREKYIDELPDGYIISVLLIEFPFITRKEINEHPELIELKRLMIKNKRQHKLTNKN